MSDLSVLYFIEQMELTFAEPADDTIRKALNLEYGYADAMKIIALYTECIDDPFMDADEFFKSEKRMKLEKMYLKLKEIRAAVNFTLDRQKSTQGT